MGHQNVFTKEQRRELSRRVKACRNRLVMGRDEYAAAIGITKPTLYYLESGKKGVARLTVWKFLRFEAEHKVGPLDEPIKAGGESTWQSAV